MQQISALCYLNGFTGSNKSIQPKYTNIVINMDGKIFAGKVL
jgi:hypothetical protein